MKIGPRNWGVWEIEGKIIAAVRVKEGERVIEG